MEKKKYVRKSKSLSSKNEKGVVEKLSKTNNLIENLVSFVGNASDKNYSKEKYTNNSNDNFIGTKIIKTELDRKFEINLLKERYPYFKDLVSLFKLIILDKMQGHSGSLIGKLKR